MNEGRFHIDIEQEVLKETALVYDHASGLSACKRHEPSELKLLSMIQNYFGSRSLTEGIPKQGHRKSGELFFSWNGGNCSG